MNIVLVSQYNTSNVPYTLMEAINKYTEDNARLICQHDHWMLKRNHDLLLEDCDLNEVIDVVKNADFFHIFGSFFNFAGINIQSIVHKNNSLVQYLESYVSRNRGDIFRFHVTSQILGVCYWSTNFWPHVPSAIYHIPQMFDRNTVQSIKPWQPGEKVIIAHAPTDRDLKGTNFFIQAIESLKAQGYTNFDFLLIEKKPYEEAIKLKNQAHIYLEELNIGGYSMNSVECMAMGQTVFCYMDNLTLSFIPQSPVVNVNKYNIAENLARFLQNPELINENIPRNIKWVSDMHDPEKVIRQWYYLYRFIKYQYQG